MKHKMKNKLFVILVICLFGAFCFACSYMNFSKNDSTKSKTTKTEQAKDNSSSSDEKTSKDSKSADVDPGDADTTDSTSANNTAAQMKAKFIGTWELKGILYSDGSFSKAGTCKYVIKADGTYTCKGETAGGSAINESGSWSLNSDKKLVTGKNTMGINGDGYMLKYTGERDGKGNKLNYAFEKDK
jgi:hypothetical protein